MSITKKYLQLDVDDTVFLVVKAKRKGAEENCVLCLKVDHIVINENGTIYTCKVAKVAVGKEKSTGKYLPYYSFQNDNIDTGYGTTRYRYPVFTTKERCIKWLKGE